MALLAEELVEEWLNRQGYFTIRGIKLGVHEIDLLATRFSDSGIECRHLEVQASVRPIGYISSIPKSHLKSGQSASSAKIRDDEVVRAGVKEWVEKKFTQPKKRALLETLFQKNWTSELVHNTVRHDRELELIAEEGIRLIALPTIIRELSNQSFQIKSASGADFVDLIELSSRMA